MLYYASIVHVIKPCHTQLMEECSNLCDLGYSLYISFIAFSKCSSNSVFLMYFTVLFLYNKIHAPAHICKVYCASCILLYLIQYGLLKNVQFSWKRLHFKSVYIMDNSLGCKKKVESYKRFSFLLRIHDSLTNSKD